MLGARVGLGEWLAAHRVAAVLVDGRSDAVPVRATSAEPQGPLAAGSIAPLRPPSPVFTRQCRTCGLHFDSVQAHRAHFQTEEHRRRVQQLTDTQEPSPAAPTAPDESKADEQEGTAARTPQVVLVAEDGERRTVWRCVVEALAGIDRKRGAEPGEIAGAFAGGAMAAAANKNWAVLLCRAGYFAGGVFRGPEVLQHRRFERYTTRKKQGRAQCNADSEAGHTIRSAGSTIRRHNETRYRELMRETLCAWAPLLRPDVCSLVLVTAPSNHRAVLYLYFEGSPLAKGDPRIRTVPITTGRPRFAEVRAVHEAMWLAYQAGEAPPQARKDDQESDTEDDQDEADDQETEDDEEDGSEEEEDSN